MPRQQINIKLPPELIEALREKASTEELTLTELIQGYCEQGLGLPPSTHQPVDTALVYERILKELDTSIDKQLDIRIQKLEEPLLNQLEERIAFSVDARISSQVALLEQRMATQLGERQETYKQWLNEAREIGRELERAKQQSPYPDESTIELARESVVEDALADSSDNVSEPTATSNTDTSPPQQRKGITATALAKRFGFKAVSSVTRRPEGESEEEFKDWSRKLDPDKIAWEQVPGTGTSKKNPKKYRKISAVSS